MANESCKVVAIEHITLDGVYQSPARPDEDTRDNFKYGGWSIANNDPKMQVAIGKHMGSGWSLLVGKTTYEGIYEGWSVRQPASPMTQALTSVQKFIVSHDPNYKPLWDNSTLLAGDAAQTVAKLKSEHDKTLIIFGSGVLVRSLIQHGLLDELVLMIHPLVLGEGYRFFDGASYTKLKLADNIVTDTGVVITTYQLISE